MAVSEASSQYLFVSTKGQSDINSEYQFNKEQASIEDLNTASSKLTAGQVSSFYQLRQLNEDQWILLKSEVEAYENQKKAMGIQPDQTNTNIANKDTQIQIDKTIKDVTCDATQLDHPTSDVPEIQLDHPIRDVLEIQLDHPTSDVPEIQLDHPISDVLEIQLDHPTSDVPEIQLDHPASDVIQIQPNKSNGTLNVDELELSEPSESLSEPSESELIRDNDLIIGKLIAQMSKAGKFSKEEIV